ncbi:hypothetical protein [Paenisporosarcina sp. TG20]|uniref:hypothetical protein n=1 Tax=Paenisporosarcina sp. TG20 TaxID=1211706 RepID=UPI00030BD441|nr:hypothetical protein [Paenisporosarcina sp. TG20]
MKFEYKLIGRGWASGYIEVNSKKFDFTASYLNDALHDLLQSLLIITPDCSPYPVKKSTFELEEEPGGTVWIFKRIDGENLSITIVSYEDLDNKVINQLQFKEVCKLDDLIKEVVKTVSKILKTHGIEGYKESWGNYDFPINEFQILNNYITKF